MLETIAVILICSPPLGHCGCGDTGSCSPGSKAFGMIRGCPVLLRGDRVSLQEETR
jgi:hypothetical protein